MLNKLGDKIEAIDSKLQKLAQHYHLLKKENSLLIEENIRLKQSLNKNKAVEESVENNLSKVKAELSQEKMVLTDNTKIKAELDRYIKEIDNCIEQLQNL